MLFDEEDWKDSEQGKDLKSALFDGQNQTNSTIPQINSTRKRKRKKMKKTKSVKMVTDKTDNNFKKVEFDKVGVPEKTGSVKENNASKKTRKRKAKTPSMVDKNVTQSCGQNSNTTQAFKSVITTTTSLQHRTNKMDWKKRKLSEMLGIIESEEFQKNVINKMSRPQQNEQKMCTKEDSNKTNMKNKEVVPITRSDALRNAVTSKLESSQFRFMNEQLYTRTSRDAKKLFANNSKSFQAYHAGFTRQVSKWPVNPLNLIINYLKKRPSKWVVGDFGCGDATLAASVNNKVHSFDLVAVNERVTVADISNVPLPDCSLDVAVFCLSLMGTNYIDFILEANRTLRHRGLLKIAEVASRFTNVYKFITLMKRMGFELERQDRKNTHFFMFDFRKSKSPQPDVKPSSDLLKPCVYKKR